ncbi:MAG: hypothetical protein Q7J65_04480 [Candidatus Marinimicrobia bacterium]|nr:hypothetical protein [Candidatus Neomarinimicrobiota bacterium]
MLSVKKFNVHLTVWIAVFLLAILTSRLTAAPKFDINEFISDTLLVPLPLDSAQISGTSKLKIIDDRAIPGRVLGIQHSKKWKYIPIDQYIVIQNDLAPTMTHYFMQDSVNYSGTLYIKNLVHWYDGKPFFNKGRKLNAYTVLEDSSGTVVSDWVWEFTLKPKKKQKSDAVIGTLMDQWLTEQVQSIQKENFHRSIYPYLYRRQLMNWWDVILLQDGYIVNAHLTLDFPADQQQSWVRGSPGIFYRNARHHQSIAIGGKDQHWYARMNKNLIRRLNLAYRFGFNNFDNGKYDHLDPWNILLINVSVNASVEYRPVYLKGLFVGIGLHGSINILPEVINRVEPGLLFTTGFILP